MNHAPEAVTFARERAGLTKRAVAVACEFSEQLMCDIEAGRRNATPEKLLKIAHVLNCPVVFLEAKRVVAPSATADESGRGRMRPNSAPNKPSSAPQSGDACAA
ncbi:helix-turn-helix transcriptional regulator [Streptomyces sp. NPDC006307]|uniref:helix-turn-helix transcriptional regulator n=1 Tax=Streptomyces sp. NPDC006307 TaxID=3156748 RepID=UPI0033B308B6